MSKSNLATVEEFYTDEEYIAFERESEERHELLNGRIIKRIGANRNHCLINGNLASSLHSLSKTKNFEVYSSNMRVRMKEGNYAYPDVVVVCDEPQFADGEFDTLLNPVIVIEILSKSTLFRDKTEKLETYQKMESIQECLIIEQDLLRIEHYIKQTQKQWLFRIYEELDQIINLVSIGCEIPLSKIYAQMAVNIY